MQGHDPHDHACAPRAAEPVLPTLGASMEGLRIGIPGGWFAERTGPEAQAALSTVSEALAESCSISEIELPGAAAGRAAAYLITNAESSAFHLSNLRKRAADYDPETRDRFLAGALLPSAWVTQAQRVRRWWVDQLMAIFRSVDLIAVPATPCTAPRIDQETMMLGGVEVPVRPNLGVLAQPFSCAGLPISIVPVFEVGSMPLGIQLIAPPWREDLCLRAAWRLERMGIAKAHPPAGLM
jgi:aspartyl-tRNA(Asn)/glutamyl-tRNA(Gln) amidotransferase subunit A